MEVVCPACEEGEVAGARQKGSGWSANGRRLTAGSAPGREAPGGEPAPRSLRRAEQAL